MNIWDEISASASAPKRTVEEVREAVNRAVADASGQRGEVAAQADCLRRGDGSLEMSVASMDVERGGHGAVQAEAPVLQQEMEAEAAPVMDMDF